MSMYEAYWKFMEPLQSNMGPRGGADERCEKDIPVVGTVHSIQLVEDDLSLDPFDLTIDWIATEKGLRQIR